MTTADGGGLDARLLRWIGAHRPQLDTLMTEEASRAVHLEFMAAEGGALPDRDERMAWAREASIRAWLRHLGSACGAEMVDAPVDLAARLERYAAAHPERLEALELEERAAMERLGASRDPEADRQDVGLVAHCALFAEALAYELPLSTAAPPAFARRVAAAVRAAQPRRRQIAADACTAWTVAGAHTERRAATAGERSAPDHVRVAQAATVWAYVVVLTETLAGELPGAISG